MEALEGNSPACEMASVGGTTGVLDRGMCVEGQLTNLGEPPVSLDKAKPEEQGYRRIKSPGTDRAAPARR